MTSPEIYATATCVTHFETTSLQFKEKIECHSSYETEAKNIKVIMYALGDITVLK